MKSYKLLSLHILIGNGTNLGKCKHSVPFQTACLKNEIEQNKKTHHNLITTALKRQPWMLLAFTAFIYLFIHRLILDWIYSNCFYRTNRMNFDFSWIPYLFFKISKVHVRIVRNTAHGWNSFTKQALFFYMYFIMNLAYLSHFVNYTQRQFNKTSWETQLPCYIYIDCIYFIHSKFLTEKKEKKKRKLPLNRGCVLGE